MLLLSLLVSASHGEVSSRECYSSNSVMILWMWKLKLAKLKQKRTHTFLIIEVFVGINKKAAGASSTCPVSHIHTQSVWLQTCLIAQFYPFPLNSMYLCQTRLHYMLYVVGVEGLESFEEKKNFPYSFIIPQALLGLLRPTSLNQPSPFFHPFHPTPLQFSQDSALLLSLWFRVFPVVCRTTQLRASQFVPKRLFMTL